MCIKSALAAIDPHNSLVDIMVKNNTGADRDRFDVLGISGPIISPADNLVEFQNRVAMVGVVTVCVLLW